MRERWAAWRRRLAPRPNASIQAFLLRATCVALLLVLGADFGWQYGRAAAAIDAAHDRALARVAAGYLRALRARDADTAKIPADVFREEVGAAAAPTLRFRVADDRGATLGGDPLLQPPPAGGARPAEPAQVYRDRIAGAEHVVVAVRGLVAERSQPALVQVAEPVAARAAALRAEVVVLGLREALLAAALLVLVRLAVRSGLRPLAALGESIRRRDRNDLAPLAVAGPREIAPVVAAMNHMLLEQRESVDQQARFLADASHQLRTPIAVLKTLVQGALFGQADPAAILPRMLSVIDRSAGLANQLLAIAKTEQLVRRADWQDVSLAAAARSVAVELAPLMADKRLDFSLQAADVSIRSDAWLLGELVKNLLANAIHHSRGGGAIGIVVRQLRADAEMIVWDHGEGVAEDVLERLFEPFNVAKGSSGIGLGLSICRQIADSMNATVHLFNRIEGGTTVGVDAVVRWPGVLRDAGTAGRPVDDGG